MSTQPVSFSEEDYRGLPEELKGKSPREIADYYANKERQLAAELELEKSKRATSTTPQTTTQPTSRDFFTDPASATRTVVRDEVNKATSSSKKTLIEGAKLVVAARHPDWARFEKDILAVMNAMPEEAQQDMGYWETAYFQIKGIKADELTKEAEQRGRTGVGSEPPTTPTPTTPTTQPTVPPEAQKVLTGLGISPESYLKGVKNLQEGTPPFTVDNVRRI